MLYFYTLLDSGHKGVDWDEGPRDYRNIALFSE